MMIRLKNLKILTTSVFITALSAATATAQNITEDVSLENLTFTAKTQWLGKEEVTSAKIDMTITVEKADDKTKLEIESSPDNLHFTFMSKIQVTVPETEKKKSYAYTDTFRNIAGKYAMFYRIKKKDIFGNVFFSASKMISFNSNEKN